MTTLATQIRDAMFVRLAKIMQWKSTRKIPYPKIQADQVPALGVYILRESMNPDGDANVGPPRFISDVTFVISMINLASKTDVLEGSIDSLVDLAQNTLLQDISFLGIVDGKGQRIIEAVTQITRTYKFFDISESYYLECSLQMTIRFRCFFEPIATVDMTEVDVTVSNFQGTVQGGPYTSVIPINPDTDTP